MLKPLFRHLSRWYTTLNSKIFIKLILIISVPNLLLIAVIAQLMSDQIEQKEAEMNNTLYVLEHAASREIRAIFNDVTTLTNQILIDPDVQRILASAKKTMEEGDAGRLLDENVRLQERYANEHTMRNLLSRSRLVWNNIFSIAIIDMNGEVYLNTSENYRIYPEDLERSELFKTVISAEQSGLAWSVSDALIKNKDMITIARKIYGVTQPTEMIGYVIVNLSLDAVRSSFETYNYYGQMIFGMIHASENGWMVYDNKKIQGGTGPLIDQAAGDIASKLTEVRLNGRIWRTVLMRMDQQDYLFVGLDKEFIHKETKEIRNKLIYGYVIFLFLALIVSLWATKILSQRLRQLIKAMRKFGQNMWGTRISLKGNDEIRIIGDQFNLMASEIEELMTNLKEQQRLKRLFELRVLEYQINPHFLYNTLDSIHWLAQENEQPKISEMVSGLSKLFRMILSQGRETITLAEEFEMVRVYLQIQKIRFEERFDFTLHLADEAAQYTIGKLVMQPLVENAIVHGMRRLRKKGLILITGYLEEDEVVVDVSDNGVGMTVEQLNKQRELLNGDVLEEEIISSSGYGMKNVDSRLKMLYGCSYRMIIRSSGEAGEGTSVQIRIKKQAMKI